MDRPPAEYVSLRPYDDEEPIHESEEGYTTRVPPTRSPPSWILFLSCIFAVTTSLISIIIHLVEPSPAPFHQQISLRRPNPYPGLEEYKSKINHSRIIAPIYDRPLSAFQMKVSDQRRTLTEDTSRTYWSKEGTIFPELDHFVVNEDTSTILQFRTLDWAMERCVLTFALPNTTETTLRTDSLDVWLLESTLEIAPYILWGHAPKRREHLGKIQFPSEESPGDVETPFDCPAVSFPTFEFGCPKNSECALDFWQDRTQNSGGILVVQHSSLDID